MYLSKYVRDLYAETLMQAIRGENWKGNYLIPGLTAVKVLESGRRGIRKTMNMEVPLGINRPTHVWPLVLNKGPRAVL